MKKGLRGRPRKFDERELVTEVMRAFWEHGYDQISMDKLCEITKLSKPSFYNVFASKEALFLSSLKQYQELYAFPLLENLFSESNPKKGFERLLNAAAKQFQNPKLPAGCLVLTGAISARGKTKNIDKELDKTQLLIMKQIDQYFISKAPLDSRQIVSQFIFSQLYSLAMFSLTMPKHFDSKDFIKSSQELFKTLLKE